MEHPRHAQGSAGRSSPPRPAPKDWTVGSGPDPVRGRVVERAGIRARASAARVVGELLRKIAERSSSAQRSVARPWGGGGAAPVHQCARTAHPSRPCRSGPRRGRRGDPLACCCRGPHLRRCRPRMPRTGHGRAVDCPGRLAREPRPVPGLRRGCVRSCRRGQRGRRPLRGQPPSRAVRLGPPPWRAPGTPSTRRSETPPEGAASAVTECPRPLVARPPIDVGPGRVLGEGHPTARRRIRVLGLVSQTTRRRRPASCGRERHEGGSRLYRWSSIDHATRDRDRGVLRRRCPATRWWTGRWPELGGGHLGRAGWRPIVPPGGQRLCRPRRRSPTPAVRPACVLWHATEQSREDQARSCRHACVAGDHRDRRRAPAGASPRLRESAALSSNLHPAAFDGPGLHRRRQRHRRPAPEHAPVVLTTPARRERAPTQRPRQGCRWTHGATGRER